MRKKSLFNHFASRATKATGSPYAFLTAVVVVIVWAITGPFLNYSNNWQLVINTGTTIITFLMVFLIQNGQNRDGKALQIKLNEILSTMAGTHNALLDLEELDESALDQRRKKYHELAEEARKKLARGESDTECADVEPEKGVDDEGLTRSSPPGVEHRDRLQAHHYDGDPRQPTNPASDDNRARHATTLGHQHDRHHDGNGGDVVVHRALVERRDHTDRREIQRRFDGGGDG